MKTQCEQLIPGVAAWGQTQMDLNPRQTLQIAALESQVSSQGSSFYVANIRCERGENNNSGLLSRGA